MSRIRTFGKRSFLVLMICASFPSTGTGLKSNEQPTAVQGNPINLIQDAYVKASNTDFNDQFGRSVAVSGNTLVVGAFFESSDAMGIDGDQTNNNSDRSGAAYVFERLNGMWTQQAYLKASNTGSFDEFGCSVAISGDTIVVGACNEGSNATGVNGDQSNNLANGSGAAYVFVRNGGVWAQQAYLKASNTGSGDQFGRSVAISDHTIVVGAWAEDSDATGVNGDQSNNFGNDSGAVYVFSRSGSEWAQQAYLKAANTGVGDLFGTSVSVSEGTLVVAARSENSDATGVDGDPFNDLSPNSGAAYVFVNSQGGWAQQAYLKASNTGMDDFFGESVSISGDTIAVGTRFEDSNATGINGNQQDNNAGNSGAVYLFQRDNGSWVQQAYIKASNTDANDEFGASVSLSNNRLLVGARQEDSEAVGLNGNQSNAGNAPNSGAAYLFVRANEMWMQDTYLKPSNTDNSDGFGTAVALSASAIASTAMNEGSNATGVNGDENNNLVFSSGAAYTFTDLGNLTIGGRVSGLQGTGLMVDNDGSDLLDINNNGPFRFDAALVDGSTYDVGVVTQPVNPDQICTISNGVGTLSGSHVDEVMIDCVTREADLSITKSDMNVIITPGSPVIYTINVINNGPEDVIGAQVQDLLPTDLLNPIWSCTASTGASCTASGSGDIDDSIDIPSGGFVFYQVTTSTTPEFLGVICNTAWVTAPMNLADPDLSNNTATDCSATDALFSNGFE